MKKIVLYSFPLMMLLCAPITAFAQLPKPNPDQLREQAEQQVSQQQQQPEAVAPGVKKVNPKQERNSVRGGNKLYNQEKYVESEIEYRKAVDANPDSPLAAYNLGNSLFRQQKYNDARAEYKNAIGTTDDPALQAKAWHNMGNISMQEQNYAQSIEEYKNALRRNPNDDETRYNLRLAQLLLKKQQQQQQACTCMNQYSFHNVLIACCKGKKYSAKIS